MTWDVVCVLDQQPARAMRAEQMFHSLNPAMVACIVRNRNDRQQGRTKPQQNQEVARGSREYSEELGFHVPSTSARVKADVEGLLYSFLVTGSVSVLQQGKRARYS